MAHKNPAYLLDMMKRRSFPDFLAALHHHVDPKEWTECWGMLNTIKQHLDFVPDYVFDVGCGRRPTLAVLMALNMKSFKLVTAIDPQLDMTCGDNINNLEGYDGTLEEFARHFVLPEGKTALVVCNHAHVKKKEVMAFLRKFKTWMYVTSPCCQDNRLDKGEFVRDDKVWSPKNEHYVFRGGEKVAKPARELKDVKTWEVPQLNPEFVKGIKEALSSVKPLKSFVPGHTMDLANILSPRRYDHWAKQIEKLEDHNFIKHMKEVLAELELAAEADKVEWPETTNFTANKIDWPELDPKLDKLYGPLFREETPKNGN